MSEFDEGKLRFTFPEPSRIGQSMGAAQYDDWSFYRNQFTNTFGQAKAVDFLYVEENTTWLIEVKDYRADKRTKPTEFPLEIAQKVRDTLAGLAAAKFNASDYKEKTLARQALTRTNLRVVLHLEQPAKPSRLKPQVIDPAVAKQKLKQLLKGVDAHPLVVNKNELRGVGWQVTTAPSNT